MALQHIERLVKGKKEVCNKKTYENKKQAGNALSTILAQADGRKKPMRFYECENCGKLHLTSQPNRKYNNVEQ